MVRGAVACKVGLCQQGPHNDEAVSARLYQRGCVSEAEARTPIGPFVRPIQAIQAQGSWPFGTISKAQDCWVLT